MRGWRDFVRHHTVIQAKRAPLRQTRTVTLGGVGIGIAAPNSTTPPWTKSSSGSACPAIATTLQACARLVADPKKKGQAGPATKGGPLVAGSHLTHLG